jgi:hypothetical protein
MVNLNKSKSNWTILFFLTSLYCLSRIIIFMMKLSLHNIDINLSIHDLIIIFFMIDNQLVVFAKIFDIIYQDLLFLSQEIIHSLRNTEIMFGSFAQRYSLFWTLFYYFLRIQNYWPFLSFYFDSPDSSLIYILRH